MSVIPITLVCSLLLAGLFIVLFIVDQRRRFTSPERDSLLPLAAEQSRTVPATGSSPDHNHAHPDHAGCGCRDGSRPPCTGCLKLSADRAIRSV